MRLSNLLHVLSRPAPGLGIALVLASLTLAAGRAQASDVRVEARIGIGDVHPGGGFEQLVEVPVDGLQIDLWSYPEPGSHLWPGDPVHLDFETNADCYVTIVSIDPRGRAFRLFPRGRDDGWVYGGEVWRLPDPGAGYTLRASGGAGEERVVAYASLAPMWDRYPEWLAVGWGPERYRTRDLCGTGWLGSGFMVEVGALGGLLVPWPDRYDAYDCTWISFRVGSWQPPRHRCGVCYRPLYDDHCSCGGSRIVISWTGRFHFDHRDRCVVPGPAPRRWHDPGHVDRDHDRDHDRGRAWSRGDDRDRDGDKDRWRDDGRRDYQPAPSSDDQGRKRDPNRKERESSRGWERGKGHENGNNDSDRAVVRTIRPKDEDRVADNLGPKGGDRARNGDQVRARGREQSPGQEKARDPRQVRRQDQDRDQGQGQGQVNARDTKQVRQQDRDQVNARDTKQVRQQDRDQEKARDTEQVRQRDRDQVNARDTEQVRQQDRDQEKAHEQGKDGNQEKSRDKERARSQERGREQERARTR